MIKQLIARNAGDRTWCIEPELARVRYEGSSFISGAIPFEQWYSIVLANIESLNRWEYIAHQDGKLYASMTFYLNTEDFHCGTCLDVVQMYTHPDHKGLLLDGFKAMKAIAKALNIKYLCFTRDNGKGEYSTTYKRVK